MNVLIWFALLLLHEGIAVESSEVLGVNVLQQTDPLKFCKDLNLDCFPCKLCYPGGWCIKNDGNQPKCLCSYGWTGSNAVYIPNNNDIEIGINRIRADSCQQACHYTHDYRNISCAIATLLNPDQCNIRCIRKTGVCINKRCRCTRGWIGPNAVYNRSLDTYVADYCDQECPYLGYGIENSGCKKKLKDIPICNILCSRNDGICLKATGQCLCPLGWTGPRAEYGTGIYDGRILADYCTVYCPYTDSRRNDFCVKHDYIERLQYAGHIAS